MLSLKFICPFCKSKQIREANQSYYCEDCKRNYPIFKGIVDFRISQDSSSKELEHLNKLLACYDAMTFDELVKYHYGLYNLRPELYRLYITQEIRNKERGEERLFHIDSILKCTGGSLVNRNICLDIGCGTGSTLFSLSRLFGCVVGVDISLVNLLLAKKFLEEFLDPNKNKVILICASAEEFPFEDNLFNLINATDLIEHISNQEKMLEEAKRILAPHGFLLFNSPNRFNIFSSEPHVNLWGLGWMPRRFMNSYVKLRKGRKYNNIRLLSYFELKGMLERVFEDNYLIHGVIADLSKPQITLRGRIVKKFPLLLHVANRLLKFFITQYQVAVFKNKISET